MIVAFTADGLGKMSLNQKQIQVWVKCSFAMSSVPRIYGCFQK